MKKSYKIEFFFAVLLGYPCILSSEELYFEKTLSWKSVEASGGYIFELREEGGKLVYQKELVENQFKVRLPEGDYEFRVGVLNRFGKNPVFSRWYPLKVRLARQPVLSEPKVGEIKDREVPIKGNNFSKEIIAYLKKAGGDIRKVTAKYKSTSEIELNLPEDLEPGEYDLVLENPKNQRIVMENYLTIPEKAGEPSLEQEVSYVKKNRLAVLWRSAVLPGWGQVYAQRKTKGIAIGISFTGAFVYYIYRDVAFINQEEKYKSLRGDIYSPSFRQEFLKEREKYVDSQEAQNVAFWILVSLYTANLVDAYFFNGPYEPMGTIQFAAGPKGFLGSIQYKF